MSISAFRANIEDVTGQAFIASELDPQRLHSKEMSERASAKVQEELLGLPGGSIVSVSGRANSDAQIKTARQNAHRQNAAARSSNDAALWVALMEQGDLDSYIAENIVGGMDDEEFSDLLADIEAETGMSFEDYAKDILGELPERRAGESDMEYQRRIMDEIIEEILEEDGSIKPEYADDPVARFIRDHEFRKEVVASVRDKDQRLENGESIETVRADARAEIESSVDAADAYATNAQTQELMVDGDNGHDGFRDEDANSSTGITKSGSFLAGFAPTSPTLAAASEDVKNQFVDASGPPSETRSNHVNPEIDIKPA
ncbi:MAG: hypothetical protein AAF412_09130 [Pseudomonadota bacterium]